MGKLQRSHIEVLIHLWMDSKQKAFSPSLHGYIYMYVSVQFSSVAQSCLTLRLHESQHARPPCLSPTPGVYSNSMSTESVMPSSRLILCRPLLLLPSIPPSIRVFSSKSTLHMTWPKYWSFSFSTIPSKEVPGLISFGMAWLDLPTPQFKSINSSALSLLHSPTLTSIYDHRKNHSLD